jgi:hypothetical protein
MVTFVPIYRRNELLHLAIENLNKATYSEKLDIMAKLGVRIYQSEDLKMMIIKTSFGVKSDSSG